MKINLVLADSDSAYLERLSRYIQETHTQFDLYSFSSVEYLENYLKTQGIRIDILLCSADLFTESVKSSDSVIKIVLSDGTYDSNDEYEHVNKYQKAENIITSILVKYAELTGRTDSAAGRHKDTKIIGVYSPVGGSGKTTISVALGKALTECGKKVLYLNYEGICSTADFFTANSGMSDVFLAAMSKNGNAGLKITANKVNDPLTGIDFVGCAESMLEFNELTAEQLCRIITQTDAMNEFDCIIVDFDSALSNDKISMLSVCDRIVIPFTLSSVSAVKINYLIKESRLHPELGEIISKAVFAANQADPSTAGMVSNLPFASEVQLFTIPKTAAFTELKNIALGNCGNILAGIVNQIV